MIVNRNQSALGEGKLKLREGKLKLWDGKLKSYGFRGGKLKVN